MINVNIPVILEDLAMLNMLDHQGIKIVAPSTLLLKLKTFSFFVERTIGKESAVCPAQDTGGSCTEKIWECLDCHQVDILCKCWCYPCSVHL